MQVFESHGESGSSNWCRLLSTTRQACNHAEAAPAEGFASAASIHRLINNNVVIRSKRNPASVLRPHKRHAAFSSMLLKKSGPARRAPGPGSGEPVIGRLRGLSPEKSVWIKSPGMHESRPAAGGGSRWQKLLIENGGVSGSLLSTRRQRFPQTRSSTLRYGKCWPVRGPAALFLRSARRTAISASSRF